MTQPYDAIIAAAAEELRVKMQTAGRAGLQGAVSVWAVFSQPGKPGYFHIGSEYPNAKLGEFECVHPGGVYGGRWSAVPYSAMASILHARCRSLRILPME